MVTSGNFASQIIPSALTPAALDPEGWRGCDSDKSRRVGAGPGPRGGASSAPRRSFS